MPPPSNRSQAPPIGTRRVQFEEPVSVRFPHFEGFVGEYAKNISITGMFIESQRPQPPGTRFNFEFKITDDWQLIRGRAEVVWVRLVAEGDDRPVGMGVRFVELEPQSKRLIRWLVEKNLRDGGEPFELDELRQTVDDALANALGEEERQAAVTPFRALSLKEEPPPATAARPPRPRPAATSDDGRPRATPARTEGWRGLLPVAALLVALFAGAFWIARGLAKNGRPADPAPAPTTPATAAPLREAVPTPLPQRPAGTPLDAVTSWARAWSEGDVEAYLAHYSPDFRPAGGIGRAEWQAARRERLTSPQHIRVAITAFEQETLEPDRVRATFFQSYRSEQLDDVVQKTLELALEEGHWRIVSERVGG